MTTIEIAIICLWAPLWIVAAVLTMTCRTASDSMKGATVVCLLLLPPIGLAMAAWQITDDLRRRADWVEGVVTGNRRRG